MKKHYEPEVVARHVPREPVPKEVRAAYLRPGELLAVQDAFPVAFQPLGTLEWHGRQNPIGCDAIKAERLCIAAAEKCGGVVMPPMFFSADAYRDIGHGYGLGMDAAAGFRLPGSFYQIDDDLLKRHMENACRNYLSRGFRLVIIVSGHNPMLQQNLMDEVCYRMKTEDGREPVCFTMEYTVIEKGHEKRRSDHAGFYETGMMQFLAGGRVNMAANAGQEIPYLAMTQTPPVEGASAEEGRICFELQTEGLARLAGEKLAALQM